jgi:hypothetical protein
VGDGSCRTIGQEFPGACHREPLLRLPAPSTLVLMPVRSMKAHAQHARNSLRMCVRDQSSGLKWCLARRDTKHGTDFAGS